MSAPIVEHHMRPFFDATEFIRELRGGEILNDGDWFVAVVA